jgi:hypothetical protein
MIICMLYKAMHVPKTEKQFPAAYQRLWSYIFAAYIFIRVLKWKMQKYLYEKNMFIYMCETPRWNSKGLLKIAACHFVPEQFIFFTVSLKNRDILHRCTEILCLIFLFSGFDLKITKIPFFSYSI